MGARKRTFDGCRRSNRQVESLFLVSLLVDLDDITNFGVWGEVVRVDDQINGREVNVVHPKRKKLPWFAGLLRADR